MAEEQEEKDAEEAYSYVIVYNVVTAIEKLKGRNCR